MKFTDLLPKSMSAFNISLGRWFGVPVQLHWSWVLLFAFIVISQPWSFALAYAGLFFIVLLHECGHCLAGKYYHCKVRDIVLYPFGGAASMEIPKKPFQEFVVAIAGPLVNALLVLPLWALSSLHPILAMISIYNVVLLVFNLIPAFPMDGGRVLRSLLSLAMGNHLKATTIAVRVGQGFCVVFALLGVFYLQPMLLLVGLLIFMAAEQELQQLRSKAFVEAVQRFQPENLHNSDDPNVRESARMIEEIQRRLAEMDERRHDER